MLKIRCLSTGIEGLDRVLGGGLPEFSFNLLTGEPGTGKTTMAQQIAFSNATRERPALYFTVLGEPTVKLLRYQQQFDFFDTEAVGTAVHFRNLGEEADRGDLDAVLARISEEVERHEPQLVVVDSFRSLVQAAVRSSAETPILQGFVQRLALRMTTWEATTLLVGEYAESESESGSPHHPVLTLADGIVHLAQAVNGDTTVRRLQVKKVRGQAPQPGFHTFRIDDAGVRVFPRMPERLPEGFGRDSGADRLSWGVAGLDAMMGGGVPRGDVVLVSGPSGTGKSVLGMHFIRQGIQDGERGVILTFEERPERYRTRAREVGLDLERLEREGLVRVLSPTLLDLSTDEAFQHIRDAVEQLGARCIVIDSLTGFAIAGADTTTERLRSSLFRSAGILTEGGATIVATVETASSPREFRIVPDDLSALADDVVVQRYVEVQGELEKVISVVLMRRSGHSHAFHRYRITAEGVAVGDPIREFHGILTGVPRVRAAAPESPPAGSGEGA